MTVTKFVNCTQNTGYEVSLELLKLYQVLPDAGANTHGQRGCQFPVVRPAYSKQLACVDYRVMNL
jgi:hypothetical protein